MPILPLSKEQGTQRDVECQDGECCHNRNVPALFTFGLNGREPVEGGIEHSRGLRLVARNFVESRRARSSSIGRDRFVDRRN